MSEFKPDVESAMSELDDLRDLIIANFNPDVELTQRIHRHIGAASEHLTGQNPYDVAEDDTAPTSEDTEAESGEEETETPPTGDETPQE